MKKTDDFCPDCHAGFQRIKPSSRRGTKGEYRCPVCDHVIEVIDGSR